MKKLLVVCAVVVLTIPLESVAATPPGKLPGARLQKLIESTRCYASLPRHAHQPNFGIVRVTEEKYRDKFHWIVDGKQRIGLVSLAAGEIEMFRSFPPAGGVLVDYRMPAAYHWGTLRGSRITIIPQGTWKDKGEMVLPHQRGKVLHLQYREPYAGKTEITQQYTLHFDPVLGYVWDCVFEMQMDEPQKYEYTNLLPTAVADSRDEHKRYQKCVWTRGDGQLCYMYQNPRSMMQWFGGDWTQMPQGGFLGFVADRDLNPFVEIIQSTPGTTLITCSVWYDQHFLTVAPQQKGEDGLYHARATYRWLSVPLPVAKEMEDAARTMLPLRPREGPMGFRQGIVNDFETLIPAGTLYNGCMWGHAAQRETKLGHSGTHSLRLRGGNEAGPVHGGPVIFVEAGKRYRLSAWVRTRGVGGKGAYLQIDKKLQSRSLTGDTDWTWLEIQFEPPPGRSFALIGLAVDGPKGTAWFDDIELVEIPRKEER